MHFPLVLLDQKTSIPTLTFLIPGKRHYKEFELNKSWYTVDYIINSKSKFWDLFCFFTNDRFSIVERGSLNKVEHKYSLRIKSCGGNMVADDGYKWRKYGQKSIKNSPNPR